MMFVASLGLGCSVDDGSVQRGPRSGKADQHGTCQQSCGERSADGCWCDDACVGHGDCCGDYEAVCLGGFLPDAGVVEPSEYVPTVVSGGQIVSADLLDPSFVMFSTSGVGIPDFLAAGSAESSLFVDFGNGNGVNGSGIHLGNGYILTARHVAAAWMSFEQRQETQEFVGSQSFESFIPGWTLRAMPAIGSASGSKTPLFFDSDYGNFNDLVILHAPAEADRSGVAGIRPVADLEPDEPVWIIGDKTGAQTRVSAGRLSDFQGTNAKVTATTVEGGFSGSPVVDVHGNLVGITVVELADGDAVTVNSELAIHLLAELAEQPTDVPFAQ